MEEGKDAHKLKLSKTPLGSRVQEKQRSICRAELYYVLHTTKRKMRLCSERPAARNAPSLQGKLAVTYPHMCHSWILLELIRNLCPCTRTSRFGDSIRTLRSNSRTVPRCGSVCCLCIFCLPVRYTPAHMRLCLETQIRHEQRYNSRKKVRRCRLYVY